MKIGMKDLLKFYPVFTKDMVYRMTQEKVLPHFKVGKCLAFETTEIDDFFKARRIPTDEEVRIRSLSDRYGKRSK